MKKVVASLLVVLCVLGVASCASDTPPDGGGDPTVASVPQNTRDMMKTKSQKDKDAWFINNITASGVDMDPTAALSTRRHICESLRQGVSLDGVYHDIHGYTGEQVGILVGSSMISSCPDVTVPLETTVAP